MQYGRFTLFEQATQNGLVVAVMSRYLEKSRHTYDLVVDKATGQRYFRAYRNGAETPFFTFPIPDRPLTESSAQWSKRVERELVAAWEANIGRPASGEATPVPAGSTPSSLGASSTPSTTESGTSSSAPGTVEESASSDSGPSNPSEPSAKPRPRSSRASARASSSTA